MDMDERSRIEQAAGSASPSVKISNAFIGPMADKRAALLHVAAWLITVPGNGTVRDVIEISEQIHRQAMLSDCLRSGIFTG